MSGRGGGGGGVGGWVGEWGGGGRERENLVHVHVRYTVCTVELTDRVISGSK